MPIADHISNVSDVTLQAPGLFSQLATGRFWPLADPENWSFAVVKASALEKSATLSLRLPKLNRKTSALPSEADIQLILP